MLRVLLLFVFKYLAKSECMESEQGHDYAEIYTPSTEKDAWDVAKPPTPPLHR